MKKYVLLIICLTVALTTYAQTLVEHPFPTDSAVWYEYRSNSPYYPAPYYNCDIKYYYSGYDTINAMVYRPLYATSKCYCEQVYFQNPCSPGPYYSENQNTGVLLSVQDNKVYYKDQYSQFKLYDYNLGVNDTMHLSINTWDQYVLQCVLIDSIQTNTGYRKQWNLVITDGCYHTIIDTLKWTEGIGSDHGLLYQRELVLCNVYDVVDYSYTNCFVLNDILVLGDSIGACEATLIMDIKEESTPSLFNVYPNPATLSFTIQLGQNQAFTAQLYNTTGQLMDSFGSSGANLEIPRNNLPPGLYFVRVTAGNSINTRKLIFE